MAVHSIPAHLGSTCRSATVQPLIARHIPSISQRRRADLSQSRCCRAFRRSGIPRTPAFSMFGGGTGIIAQAMKDLFGIAHVTVDRCGGSLSPVARYRDLRLRRRDPAVRGRLIRLCHLHQCAAPRSARRSAPPMRECARVAGAGPIYIKDHLAASAPRPCQAARTRPDGQPTVWRMVQAARYLTAEDWLRLSAAAGYRDRAADPAAPIATAVSSVCSPIAPEVTMRWVPAAGKPHAVPASRIASRL